MYSGIYRFYIDYDVVASYSLQALEGYVPGWCYPVLVSQTPLIYELYVDRWEEKPEINPGKEIGVFELRRRSHGECEIIFSEVPFPVRRSWTDDEKRELEGLSKDEMRERLLEIDEKISADAEAEHERLKKHFDDVVKVYFQRLQDWDITPNKDTPAVQVSAEKAKDTRQRGKSGRPHLQEDVWAWEQVNIYNRQRTEVYKEWRERIDVKARNLQDPERQFNRITKPEWGNKQGQNI